MEPPDIQAGAVSISDSTHVTVKVTQAEGSGQKAADLSGWERSLSRWEHTLTLWDRSMQMREESLQRWSEQLTVWDQSLRAIQSTAITVQMSRGLRQ